ncbi:MAG: L,D-transpeptidase family protein [Verrucomicrobiaceae bacterium]|nr:L,D-transpeptidase family protein [Verrucomicrobiaceae bacterium]
MFDTGTWIAYQILSMVPPVYLPRKWLLSASAGGGLLLGSALVGGAGDWFRVPITAVAVAESTPANEMKTVPTNEGRILKAIPLSVEIATPSRPIPDPLTPKSELPKPDASVQTAKLESPKLKTDSLEPKTGTKTPSTSKAKREPDIPNRPAASPKPKEMSLWNEVPAGAARESVDYFLSRHLWISEHSAVYQSVLLGDNELLEALLRNGFDPNESTASGDTPLCAAVRTGNVTATDQLLWYGANASQPGRGGMTPICLASLRRFAPIMRLLLASGADPNTTFPNPVPADILESVLIKDLRYYLSVDSRITPLMACASRGDVEGAATLLRAGAKTSSYTRKYKRYALNFAAQQGYLFLMRVLLGKSPDEEPKLLVTVDLSQQKAWITKDGQVVDKTSISSGRAGYSTPTGRYVVTDKHRTHTSTLYHVAMPWFMRLNCSAIGLHSGHVTGRPASHGCIRLPWEKARDFFNKVDVGDEVEIVH